VTRNPSFEVKGNGYISYSRKCRPRGRDGSPLRRGYGTVAIDHTSDRGSFSYYI
jgi:hypothetical protein